MTGEAVDPASAAASLAGSAPAARPTLVSVESVSKAYASDRGDVVALRDVDLSIVDGEFISILGPSGCGKSTLLKCIAGLETVTSGQIRLSGLPVTKPPADAGLVFQRDVLLDWRNVIDNVLLPVEFRRLDRKAWEPKAMQLLDTLGLAKFAKSFPWELSGGMRQRVAICRGLVLDPKLLLMDEPFGALDAITRDELNMELERIWERSSKTAVFITHSIGEAVFLSTRVVVMDKSPGRVVEILPIDLPRPRTLAIRETAEFTAYVRRLRSIFESLGVMKKS